jgi:hypothetical protein
VITTVGAAFTVIFVVAVTTPHPPEAAIVYVIAYVPGVLVPGVIAPVAALMLSPAGRTLYVPPGVPVNVTF